ncbi:hypothetical protein BU16DRAFT_49729 [Lophium mytilinum]|uniref:Uncharacterized protein n=1 Tax=Lophium mytilinum TaxID=390894 RepID=A0A6A6QSZ7_9PEZI|nr:hypothetical protein BU16DRAFT_49729 [Lophium mytilinum]
MNNGELAWIRWDTNSLQLLLNKMLSIAAPRSQVFCDTGSALEMLLARLEQASRTPGICSMGGGPQPPQGAPSTFGQPSQQPQAAQNSPFSNPPSGQLGSSPFGSSAFGQPSQQPQAAQISPFANLRSGPLGSSPFGQQTQQQPSSVAQSASPFGGLGQSNTSPSPFGPSMAPQQPSVFQQTQQQPSSMVQPANPFGGLGLTNAAPSPFGQATASQQSSGFQLHSKQISPEDAHKAFLDYAKLKSKDIKDKSQKVMNGINDCKPYSSALRNLLTYLQDCRKRLVDDPTPLNKGDVKYIRWNIDDLLTLGRGLQDFGDKSDANVGKTLSELSQLIPRLQTARQTPGVSVLASQRAPTQPSSSHVSGSLPPRNAGQPFSRMGASAAPSSSLRNAPPLSNTPSPFPQPTSSGGPPRNFGQGFNMQGMAAQSGQGSTPSLGNMPALGSKPTRSLRDMPALSSE